MAVFRTVERVRLCAILGVAIAAASPLASQIDWSGVHPLDQELHRAGLRLLRIFSLGRRSSRLE